MLLLACTSPAFAGDHYVEIWNPPEARGGVHHDPAAAKAAKHKHVAPRLVDAGVRPPALEAAPKAGQSRPHALDRDLHRAAPGTPEIPRLFTPDGNVLRVGTHGAHGVEVVR
ncbi:hypothetical protein [Burkholderia glumae]|uniref:Uncharacterized protein n=1 Tax=Burkholderia glumae TaxID=337 RepID=A0AAP9XYZ8_BURGL|nr:hypothetical protein [Burkholderia glumae]ACR32114.1 Hypothetical protein bglu_2g17760 [Burkholderia glumae BGR1]AJY63943.1 hypothetical protein KS03_4154 [Burkholderia glumae LMG 2196 = ATCC 33617]KHJ64496.1 hypothetical protein NCPPB3923_02630 [Burkholderia glumae]MCM2484706.1 hypothetical protein [Burkholderia glumae]MCM2510399.1 hypothetical protein [Burkholderia glumae]